MFTFDIFQVYYTCLPNIGISSKTFLFDFGSLHNKCNQFLFSTKEVLNSLHALDVLT